MTPALALFVREWRVARRIGGGASVGAVFFLILVAVMPFALGPDLNLLARLGPAILWIAALLATLLGLDRLFQADHEDGSLDILVAGSLPLEVAVLVKCAAHWTASALPLIVVSPFFGLMLAMTPAPLGLVAATLAAGTPALTMIGAIGAALTVSLRRGGLLMAVLVLPLTIPVLIFGVAAASAASGGAAPFLDSVPDALRAVAVRDRRRALRRRRGAEICEGVNARAATCAVLTPRLRGYERGRRRSRSPGPGGQRERRSEQTLRVGWSRARPMVLSILRIVVGLLFPPARAFQSVQFSGPVPVHLSCNGLLILAAFARDRRRACFWSRRLYAGSWRSFSPARWPSPYFMAHAPHSFYPAVNGGEVAVMYCFIFFYLRFCWRLVPLSVDRTVLKQD